MGWGFILFPCSDQTSPPVIIIRLFHNQASSAPWALSGNQPTVLESAEAFHPEKNKWECLPPMPTPRCACSSVVVKNCLLAVGGVNQGLSDAVEALCVSDS